jgi:hypothetical protein
MELSSLSITTDPPSGREDAAFEGLLALSRTLPADLPPELAQVARAVCLADLDRQFEFGLEALLAGLEA